MTNDTCTIAVESSAKLHALGSCLLLCDVIPIIMIAGTPLDSCTTNLVAGVLMQIYIMIVYCI